MQLGNNWIHQPAAHIWKIIWEKHWKMHNPESQKAGTKCTVCSSSMAYYWPDLGFCHYCELMQLKKNKQHLWLFLFHEYLKNKTTFKNKKNKNDGIKSEVQTLRGEFPFRPFMYFWCLSIPSDSLLVHPSSPSILQFVCVCVERGRELSETLATPSWEISGNNTADISSSRKVCLDLTKPGVHNSLMDIFCLCAHMQERQVPLCIAGVEAFLDPSAKGCSENTWAVASDETGENVSLCTVLAQSG